ncbi:hypothetical protein HXA34_20190 [Salipaludibacillus agaradhaerens]|jgi:predicted translin family RNA/ssDNA-binding protein|uniref:hypothetical protein n=1 Tax=Salipaludibacillus agaradhaerens TaxID=76935 RepID=UPI002150E153|nr:hypothetical protein [Salipaludibacillus agaradhaerens]MCR6108613.1 hypothetical protein [Salipaludibacillus agaradhaerens]MCR6120641.1 hypothetical protein [Salipaludibacillus agaradhaerens]
MKTSPFLTRHTHRSLHDEWERRYKETSSHIKELKEKLKDTANPEEQLAINGEIQELSIQANLIHQFLADIGTMVLAD